MNDVMVGRPRDSALIAAIKRVDLRAYTMLAALALIWITFYVATDGTFLTARNFSNLTRQMSITGILAVGMLMVIITGNIDLSVGSIVGLTGGLAAILHAWQRWSAVASITSVLIVGLLIGLMQGAMVAYARIPSFVVTLGGLLAFRGAIKGLTHGTTVGPLSSGFKLIGQEYLSSAKGWWLAGLAIAAILIFALKKNRSFRSYGIETEPTVVVLIRAIFLSAVAVAFVAALNQYAGLPLPVFVLLFIAFLFSLVMRRSVFGRYLYAIGGNSEASRLSGINIQRHIVTVFGLTGLLAGAAGIIYTARVGSGSPDAGKLLELDAIAACVIGGASLVGGQGTVIGAIIGALIMASLDNGMSLMNLQDFYQDIIKGAILVFAVSLDMIGRQKHV